MSSWTRDAERLWQDVSGHEALQSLMLKKGLPFHKTNHEEVYRFGAGAPVLSTEAFLYAVQIYDHKSWVRIAVVDNTPDDNRVAECPGLVGPAELARWKVQIDFAKLQVAIHGKWQPTVLSPSRHPNSQPAERWQASEPICMGDRRSQRAEAAPHQ